MSEHDFTLTSGAQLHVTTAGFDDCSALFRALAKCLKSVNLSDDILSADISVMKDFLVEAVGSVDLERALLKCAERTSYEGQKFTKALMDDPTLGDRARADYIEVAAKVIEVDAKPFFAKAFSALKERLASAAVSPRPS